MNYVHSIRRYWWVALFGVAMACLTGILLVYKVERISPPKLVKRAKPTFTASTELLVDSRTGSYLRTLIPTDRSPKGTKTPSTTTTSLGGAVDTKALVDAANLFPLFIESDSVYALRRKLTGDIPGLVQAKALYASLGVNRFRPSVIPVVQVTATAPKPSYAVVLVEGTARAFQLWLGRRQNAAHIPSDQRIVVRQLHVPRGAVATGGATYTMPGLASLGVLALFLALAVLLDQRGAASQVPSELRPLPERWAASGERVERSGLAASSGTPDKPLG